MSTALYRRYRPETFEDVIGQEHVTEPLMQALRTGRVTHAYLFSGPRGCGKTTSARILARCLNCEQGPTPDPCGACDSCVALARGGPGSVDVIEIDAASHGGVEDARDLRERASYGPAQSRYKVYIIDEAHMVTPQGFNALLKIVEEPPEHVKFVFATTEPEKVIGTIRSRTHHYPFRLVPPARLQAYMEQLCQAEGVAVEPGVLSFVVRAGGGSVRDSLSVLDQLIAGSGEKGLTYERAASLLGFTDGELLDATIDAFAAGDAAGVFHQIDRVIETGLDPRRFVEDLLERFRDLIVVAAVPEGASSILRGLPEDQVDRMRQQASAFGTGSLSRAADVVNAGLTDMTGATAPRLQLELIAARVLLPGAAGEQGYAARLDRLERRLDVGGAPSGSTHPRAEVSRASAPAEPSMPSAARESSPEAPGERRPSSDAAPDRQPPSAPRPSPAAAESTRQERSTASDSAAPEGASAPTGRDDARPADSTTPEGAAAPTGPGGMDLAAVRRAWPDVLGRIFRLKRSTWTFLSEHAQVLDYDGQRLVLGIATVGLANTFRTGVHAEVVRQALIDALGIDVRVEGIPTDQATRPQDPSPSGDATSRTSGVGGPTSPGTGSRPDAPSSASGGGSGGRAGATPGSAQTDTGRRGPQPDDWSSKRSSPEPTSGDWSSRAAAPGSAPSWATGDDVPPPAGSRGARPTPAHSSAAQGSPGSLDDEGGRRPPATPDPGQGRSGTTHQEQSPWERAKAEVASSPEERDSSRVADDSAVSEDDEDIADAGEVGLPVVEKILGGTVIREVEE